MTLEEQAHKAWRVGWWLLALSIAAAGLTAWMMTVGKDVPALWLWPLYACGFALPTLTVGFVLRLPRLGDFGSAPSRGGAGRRGLAMAGTCAFGVPIQALVGVTSDDVSAGVIFTIAGAFAGLAIALLRRSAGYFRAVEG